MDFRIYGFFTVHTRQLAYRHTPIICIQRLKLSKHTYVLKLLEYFLSVITLPATRQRRCEDVSCQLVGRDLVWRMKACFCSKFTGMCKLMRRERCLQLMAHQSRFSPDPADTKQYRAFWIDFHLLVMTLRRAMSWQGTHCSVGSHRKTFQACCVQACS